MSRMPTLGRSAWLSIHRSRRRPRAGEDAGDPVEVEAGAAMSRAAHRRSLPGVGVRVLAASVLTGIAAGAGGIALTVLLHATQHLAFGYTEQTFLVGVQRAGPARRVVAMGIGGLVVGGGWWALRRWMTPLRPMEEVLADHRTRIPLAASTADAALQIIAVGFGASLGREGAPRQVGAALASWLAARLQLDPAARRTIIACGAGAGLAAVYNVPLGGALFTLEVLLTSTAIGNVVPALISTAMAAALAWPVTHLQPTYQLTPQTFHWPLLVWAVLVGPVAGAAGGGFLRLTTWCRRRPPTGWRLPIATTVVFTAVGALAIPFPQLLGNGKGPAQLAFDGALTVVTFAVLTVLKPLATAASLSSGANGGLLTPALATGAMLGAATGGAWSLLWPGAPTASYAIIGGAAFLATTQRAPLCAIVLVLEFTHTGLALAVPLLLGVGAAIITANATRPATESP